ncbi:MAG: SagB/ThcOx family dehydrogenase [Planctomycetota bacterium]
MSARRECPGATTRSLWVGFGAWLLIGCGGAVPDEIARPVPDTVLELPAPRIEGDHALEALLQRRRSIRDLRPDPLELADIGQLAWAAQGITDEAGHRTAPSANAVYPLELWVALPSGLHRYDPASHTLARYDASDLREAIYETAYRQEVLRNAPAVFIVCGVFDRMATRFEASVAPRYVHLEAGHAAQNLLLQAVALDLAAVPIGGVDSYAMREALGLTLRETPLYAIPVGHPR